MNKNRKQPVKNSPRSICQSAAGSRQSAANSRPSTVYCRLCTADCVLLTVYCRLPTAVCSQFIQHLHHLLPFQDHITDPVIADPFTKLVAKFQLFILHISLEVPEGYIGEFFQLGADLV